MPRSVNLYVQVDVFVNGQLVPFSMKIGEAGEAFFVFETEEEIPDNLATSPILQATRPGETNTHARETGRFGAGPASPPAKDIVGENQEPEFLDLDATAGNQSREGTPSPSHTSESRQDETSKGPGILSRTAQLGKAVMSVARETEKAEEDKLKDKTVMEALKETEEGQRDLIRDKATAAYVATERAAGVDFPSVEDKGDEVLPEPEIDEQGPDVKYTDSKSSVSLVY